LPPWRSLRIAGLASFLIALALAVPRPPDGTPPNSWDVLVVLLDEVDVEFPGLRRPQRVRMSLNTAERALVRREVASFCRRVSRGTGGRLEIRPRVVAAKGPLTSLSGPGPYWIGPEDVAPLLPGIEVGSADTVMVFAKIGIETGAAVPVRHLGGALGGDDGLSGACFAGIGFRPSWIDGGGTVALHEWLHGLRWALAEVGGFPAIPDPDSGRIKPTCCPDAPAGDGAYADHLLEHLTAGMLAAADAREGPARDDRHLRHWSVDGRTRDGSWRTVRLAPGDRTGVARLPRNCLEVLVTTSGPVRVESGAWATAAFTGRRRFAVSGDRLTIARAASGGEIRFRVEVKTSTEAP